MIKKFIKKFIRVKKEKVLIPTLMSELLKNKVALITGGSSGIGYAIAKAFIQNGATVIITGRNDEKLKNAQIKLIEECNCDVTNVFYEILDVTEVKNIKIVLERITKVLNKRIDIFVNNAGINGGDVCPITKEEDYDRILDTNLKGMYFMSQEIVEYMIKNKIKGNILNVTSSSALRPAISPYMLSKWGERGLTLGLAKKYLPYGIIVNGIAPGSTATPMLKKEELNDLNCDYALTGRYIAPEEIGNIATMLVSDMGKMIIGDTIYITGGAGVITFDDMNY